LLAHVKAAGYLGAAAMRHEPSRPRGLVWGGVAELAGLPAELLEAFSTRTGEVQAEFAELWRPGTSAGLDGRPDRSVRGRVPPARQPKGSPT